MSAIATKHSSITLESPLRAAAGSKVAFTEAARYQPASSQNVTDQREHASAGHGIECPAFSASYVLILNAAQWLSDSKAPRRYSNVCSAVCSSSHNFSLAVTTPHALPHA
jgi:hypothetical protein